MSVLPRHTHPQPDREPAGKVPGEFEMMTKDMVPILPRPSSSDTFWRPTMTGALNLMKSRQFSMSSLATTTQPSGAFPGQSGAVHDVTPGEGVAAHQQTNNYQYEHYAWAKRGRGRPRKNP